ncbi:MAG: inositol monophosphatase [Candidatus Cloacimonadota bacterium]|nr:MAG: inositol monophosphatase [Candidatus Cloacimonadota bacterium]
MLLSNLGKLTHLDIDTKAKNDFVTKVDKESEECIVRILKEKTPDFDILTEETTPGEMKGEYKWIIDPLDGTTNYIHSFPFFAISIALEEKGNIVLGLVYDPLRKELFFAEKGEGAFLNDKKISVSKRSKLGECFLATGFPFRAHSYIDGYLKIFKEMFLKSSGVRRAGSAVLDLAYTACGRLDGFWEMKLSPWDVAAGSLIIKEAGGKVSDWEGGEGYIFTGNIVGSNGHIHTEMLAIIKEHFRF